MNIAVVYDEFADASSHEDEIQVITNALMGTIFNLHAPRPEGEWVGVEITRQ